MARIFSEDAITSAWLAAERALAEAEARAGLISREDADSICESAQPNAIDHEMLWENTRIVGYPILPLVRMVAATLPPGPDGRLHYGATTQDIMDTGLAIQLASALDRLEELLSRFGNGLSRLVELHAATVMAGRTHAQQAVPTTFGAKLAVVLAECARHRHRLAELRPKVALVSLYGAGGTSASLQGKAPAVRRHMAESLGLGFDDVPWHVARDGIAEFGLLCSMLAATAGRFAREIIELARTEIGEVSEAGGHHRGASSTMPQKRNPISSEVVVGMAAVAGSVASGMLAAMRPTHERSAGEWQMEWFLVPELAVTAAGALYNSIDIAAGLEVFPGNMTANLAADGGLVLAEAYMMRLAPILGRERAHDLVYEAAGLSRTDGVALVDAVKSLLHDSGADDVAELTIELEAGDYLGDVKLTCEQALARWANQELSTDRSEEMSARSADVH